MRLHIEKQIGMGPEMVYAYHFPSQHVHNGSYPIKIGHAKTNVFNRIKEQQASMQENPVVDVLIKCEHSLTLEKVVHSRLMSCNLNAFGNEWFLTTPEKILEIWWDVQDAKNLSIGEQIRFFRASKGLSQQALAKASGVRQETISKLETNPDSAMWKTVENVVRELGLRIVLTPD